MIINDSFKIDEARATFMDKLKASKVGDSFNIYSGSRNFVVTQVAGDRFKVVPGKGFDKGMTAYINKCYIEPKSDQIVTRNALQNFIKTINKKNGWREDLNIDDPDEELNESLKNSKPYDHNTFNIGNMSFQEFWDKYYSIDLEPWNMALGDMRAHKDRAKKLYNDLRNKSR